eukprot:scaffold49251_cov23-Prasinocladus_malaysianus.AAC.1
MAPAAAEIAACGRRLIMCRWRASDTQIGTDIPAGRIWVNLAKKIVYVFQATKNQMHGVHDDNTESLKEY